MAKGAPTGLALDDGVLAGKANRGTDPHKGGRQGTPRLSLQSPKNAIQVAPPQQANPITSQTLHLQTLGLCSHPLHTMDMAGRQTWVQLLTPHSHPGTEQLGTRVGLGKWAPCLVWKGLQRLEKD